MSFGRPQNSGWDVMSHDEKIDITIDKSFDVFYASCGL